MPRRLFTFGYEGLSLSQFVARLQDAGILTIVDVRANPISRKPGFSKSAFAAALHAVGISYVHMPRLGCPKPIRDRYKSDGDWSAYTQDFCSYLNEQTDVLTEVARIAEHSPSCLVCFEADFTRCHRTYVARAAGRIGKLRVVHLIDQTEMSDLPRLVAA
jgi:uncharacterized protein (DUF488 family)